ncbi:response regulator transcription factor [Immundisolibacter sp.]|uniref:response regulator n=1 Tax=Immundisolibacter sp. TaxID=1934948 RepID=UPI00261AE36D|nr:response regulator transcription factor [Immundisolibacter sp.]MDD3650883.1 response regulator transcription factor [Immundisolibacter sp.]
MRLLLVEDDAPLAAALTQALREQGFAVNHVRHGAQALHAALDDPPELVVLDLGLPDMDGLELLRRLRSAGSRLPILVLTARDALSDKVAGLDLGADDYLPKPFDVRELEARIRALGRRLGEASSSVITIGDLRLDTARMQVHLAGRPVELARREYMLLKALAEHPGRVLTREALESKLYAWGEEVASNALEVHVHHLRRKLGPELILTVRGVGYRLRAA